MPAFLKLAEGEFLNLEQVVYVRPLKSGKAVCHLAGMGPGEDGEPATLILEAPQAALLLKSLESGYTNKAGWSEAQGPKV